MFLTKYLAVLCFLVLFSSQISLAALDTTFGAKGKTTINVSGDSFSSSGMEMFVQPSGRIVIRADVRCTGQPTSVPGYAFVGLTEGGLTDETFGTANGRVISCSSGIAQYIVSTKMLPDGKFISLGYTATIQTSVKTPFLVVRHQDGEIDQGFSANIALAADVLPWVFSVQNDGKIMAAVNFSGLLKLVRLNPDGSRDQTFGTNGVRDVPVGRLPPYGIADLVSLSNGKTLMPFDNGDIVGFTTEGFFDRSFGNFGTSRINSATPLYIEKALLQADEKLVLVGYTDTTNTDTFLARFSPRGKVDSSFGAAGKLISDFAPGGDDYAFDGVVQTDGKIIICGIAKLPATANTNFLVARYSANGELEASMNVAFPGFQISSANAISLQPDGKILVAGAVSPSSTFGLFGGQTAVARMTGF